MHMSDNPAVVFLIPFASRKVKAKWELACWHLEQTLASIANSADKNYRVVIAGNERPDFLSKPLPKVEFLSLGLPMSTHSNPPVAVRLDKLAKIDAAWRHTQTQCRPKYVMKLDADDFISSRLVGWLATAEGPGYLFQQGWLWRDGARHLIQRTDTLDRVCGSCLAIRSELCDLTGPFLTEVEGVELTPENSQFAARDHYSLVPGSGTSTLLLNDSHQRYAAQFAHLGHALPALPFAGVVYRDRNTDSITGRTGDGGPKFNLRMKLGAWRRTRLISSWLRAQFMLP
jgi:hypothetical protein